jgi:hypothetical protein
LLRDSYILESELFYDDNKNNKDVFSKYIFEDSKGNTYSLLKLFSKIKQISGTRITEFGVAILSDNDLELCKINYNLLEKLKITFANHSISNGQFNTNDFSNITDAIWKVVHDNDLFNEIIIKERTHSAISKRYAVILKTNEELYDISTIKSKNYQKIYFVTDKDFFELLRSKSDFTHDSYIQEGHNLSHLKYEKINNHYNVNTIRNEELSRNTSRNSISDSYKPYKASKNQNSNTRILNILDFIKNIHTHYYIFSVLILIILILVFRMYNPPVTTPTVTNITQHKTIHSFSGTTRPILSFLSNKDTLIKRMIFDTTFILTTTRNGITNEVIDTKRTFLKLDSNVIEETKKYYTRIVSSPKTQDPNKNQKKNSNITPAPQPTPAPPTPAPPTPAPPTPAPPTPAQQPKADPPKADPPKADPPKADPPKADPPKADPQKASVNTSTEVVLNKE